jgi:hypothetical protein
MEGVEGGGGRKEDVKNKAIHSILGGIKIP